MKNFYYKLGRKRFLLIAAFLLLCGDIFFSWYTLTSIGNFESFKASFQEMLANADNSEQINELRSLPEGYLKEVFELTINMLYMLAAAIISFHLLMYTLLVLEKRTAFYYVSFLSFCAILVCALTSVVTSVVFLLPTATYFFCFMGLWTWGPTEKNQESQSS